MSGSLTVSSLIDLLKSKGLRICFAESLTGGMISSGIVDIPGASDVFDGSVVCYTNDVKINVLNVGTDIIAEYTEVSSPCAKAMASGVRKLMGSDISIAVTGYADGRSGGTVYIGYDTDLGNDSYLLKLSGDRNDVRKKTCEEAYSLIRKLVMSL
ncbi:MAG: CinA family protein [Clostridiales bacterium]|nr:CinA family protein [Clostridiales bacterium]